MQNWIEKGFLMGLGVLSLTKDKAEQMKEQLINQGELGRNEAEEFFSGLLKKGEEEKDSLEKFVQEKVQKILKETNVVTREEYEQLAKRVEQLESQLAAQTEHKEN